MESPISKPDQRLVELSRIVQEVDKAADLASALRIVVRRTRAVMHADVCSVYFSDDAQRRHVVAATDGLSSRYVGKLSVDFGRGVIGKVAQARRPINLDQVPETLDQGFLAQTGLPLHAGFLGVPILHKAQVQGALVVRQRHPRRFDDADEAFLATLAAQLGGAIAYAKASGDLCAVCRHESLEPRSLEGRTGAPGIALGLGAWVFSAAELQTVPDRECDDPETEQARFLAAVERVHQQTRSLATSLNSCLAEADRALFDAFAMILESPEIQDTVLQLIRQGQWAPGAVRSAIETYAEHFDAMDDPYLRERANDVRALGGRVIAQLLGEHKPAMQRTEPTILVGRQLSAMDIGEALSGNLVGIISADGSALSHAAILARSLGIPAVMGVNEAPLTHLDGQALIIDGDNGHIQVRPDQPTRRVVEQEIMQQRARHAALEPVRHLPARSTDGHGVHLFINAGLTALSDSSGGAGSDGVGLFRSELPFMMFDRFPSEAEQQDIYRKALSAVAPLPLVLRTLDAGGDKPLPYLSEQEDNPALGWRGIRFTLDHPDIFITQVRAALLADIGLGNLRLLLPMVSTLDEVLQAEQLLDQAIQQLTDEGLSVRRPPLGIMIEVPAAIFQTEMLARHVDFLSVGTNDLAQYLLATDRNNPRVSAHLDSLHPSLIRALHLIVEAARRAGKPISVCGEMASDPALAMLLVGMGFDGLSLNPTALLPVKSVIRQVSFHYMRSLAKRALAADTRESILTLLQEALERAGHDPLKVSGGIPATASASTTPS